jgi:hypothetical protein
MLVAILVQLLDKASRKVNKIWADETLQRSPQRWDGSGGGAQDEGRR